MNWLIFLFAISVCGEVSLTEDTDPFTNITTVKGFAPSIEVNPLEKEVSSSGGLKITRSYPEFRLRLKRQNNDAIIEITQSKRYEGGSAVGEVHKPILGSESQLLLLFEDDTTININYSGQKTVATDSNDREGNTWVSENSNSRDRRWVTIQGEFRLSNNQIQMLKSSKVKLLRVEYENLTTDREFNSNNENYFVKYLSCLEI